MNKTESFEMSKITAGTKGTSNGIPSTASPQFIPSSANESFPYSDDVVSNITPTTLPSFTYIPSCFLGPYGLRQSLCGGPDDRQESKQ